MLNWPNFVFYSTNNHPLCTHISGRTPLWEGQLNKRTILIIDDDEDLREGLSEQIGFYDEFAVITADSAQRGVSIAKTEDIALAIVDVGLPDLDGREAVRLMRSAGFKAPVVMLTGHTTDADHIVGLEAGANDYVTKPFRFAVLLARIRAHLRQFDQSEDATFAIGPYSFKPSGKILLEGDGKRIRLTE